MKTKNKPQKITYGGRVFWEALKRARSCGNKVRHVDEVMAKEAASAMKVKTGYDFNAYFCSNCRSWHIGRDHTKMGEPGYDGKRKV
jgi:hypothetical protein